MEQKIYFQNSKGNKLCGILSNLEYNKKKPIIILVHGFNSNKNTKNFNLLRSLLEKKNISTFRFDIYGHGESDGKFENLTITEAVDDILQAIKLLKRKGFSQIGLVGSSFGGNASIIAATKIKNLFILALKSPVSNYEEKDKKSLTENQIQKWEAKGFRFLEDSGKKLKLNYTFFADSKNNNGYVFAPKIKIPTLIVHGDADQIVPVEQSIKISKLIPECKLVLIKNADHTYTNPKYFQLMSKTIADFILKKI